MKTKAERDPELVCKHEGCGAYHMAQSEFCYGHDLEYRKAKRENKKFHGNIIEAFENPSFFGSLIADQSTWTNWKILLKAIFHTVDYPPKAEMEIFTELTGREKWNTRKFREVFIAAGRRGGKSFISSALAVWLSLAKDWSKYLQAGEKAYVMVIASDRSQAQIIMNYAKAILALPKFKDEVEKELREEIHLVNNIIIAVKTCSIAGVRGFTCPIIICDEIAFWRSRETGANPDREVLASLRPTQATVKSDALLIAISSPYSKQGILYEAHAKYYGKDDKNTLVIQAPSIKLNPTLSEDWIQEQLDQDYETNKAEYLAIFRDDVSSFLPTEVIENAVIPGRNNLPPIQGVRYKSFADGASGSKSEGDSFTLCIGHTDEHQMIIIDFLIEKTPPFKPADVISELCTYLKNYNIHEIVGDKWSLGFMSGEFQEHGIKYVNSKLSASEIYLDFVPRLISGQVELPDNKKLLAQLRGLERKTRQQGHDLITCFQGGQDDLAVTAAGVCTIIPSTRLFTPEEIEKLLPPSEETVREWRRKKREKGYTDKEREEMFKRHLR